MGTEAYHGHWGLHRPNERPTNHSQEARHENSAHSDNAKKKQLSFNYAATAGLIIATAALAQETIFAREKNTRALIAVNYELIIIILN